VQEGNDPRTAADRAVEHAGPTVTLAGVILADAFASPSHHRRTRPRPSAERKTDAQPVGSAARSGHYRALGSARTHAETAAGGGCGRWRRSLYFDRHSGLVMPC
jgi:hypothetical protein